ncbi:MAG: chromosomal replication initiator DnaA [Pseudomonadota bacterium]
MTERKPEQLALPLAYQPARGRETFLVSESNRAAWGAVTRADAPRRLVLSGPEGAGKTHLASIWGESNHALRVTAREMTEQRQAQLIGAPAVVIEDVDRLAKLPGPAARQVETLIFHLCNLAAAEDMALLITGRAAPAHWRLTIPDVASRLTALPHVPISPPDDELLSAVLHKLVADRQMLLGDDVVVFLLRRMERSFAAAEDLIERLDRLALARRKPITRPLARELFRDEEATEGEGEI